MPATQHAAVEIVPLSRAGRNIARFLKVPYAIYSGDPDWVAPLLADLKPVFGDGNPLFEHAQMMLWVATRDGRDVGRVAGILHHAHNQIHGEATGFFGFFESIDDPAIAKALFDAVSQWAGSKQLTKLLGPMNPTSNDECGLLVEGFDRPPVVMMTYNPRYYVKLIEGEGFRKAKDLLAYHFPVAPKPLARLTRLADGVRRREPDLVVRQITRKSLAADLAAVKEVYNTAWEENWGFVPMTGRELEFMAKRLKPILEQRLTLIAEIKGEPVGFMLSLPDFNEAIAPMRGRLLSPTVFNFLQYLAGRRHPRIVRCVTLGMKKGYRQRGIDAVMFAQSLQASLDIGFKECEVSWLLEDNVMVNRSVNIFEGRRYKTYRLYERDV